MATGGEGGYERAPLSPSIPSRRAIMVVPLAACLATVTVCLGIAYAGGTGAGLIDVGMDVAAIRRGGTGEGTVEEGRAVEGLQWQTYSFVSLSSLTPGKMGTATIYLDLTHLHWNKSADGEGDSDRVFQVPLRKEIKCWWQQNQSQCEKMLPEDATSHAGVPEEKRGAYWPTGLTMDITPGYFGRFRDAATLFLMNSRLRSWATPGTLFIFGLRDPISAYASRFMYFNRIQKGDPVGVSHLGPEASHNIEGWLGMEMACAAMEDTPDLASIAVAAYAREKGGLDPDVLLAMEAWKLHLREECDPRLSSRGVLWGLYIHNYALTTYMMQGVLGDLASADNVLVYQMEAWGKAREAFMQRVIVMLFGTVFANSHPFYITDAGAIRNQGKDDPLKAQYGTLSAASRCRLARQLQHSATEMVHMVHDLEARGAVQTFLPDTFAYGSQPDWWGGLEATYCAPNPLRF